MRRAISIILLLYTVLSVCGQEFNTHWIYAPQADSTSHVWFRHAYLSNGRPRQASITVTTTGYYKLYVNECNVGTALYYPLRHNGDDSVIETSFDVTPYLRKDTNVVALLYSPVYPSISHKQISVDIYGIDHNDFAFSYSSDESWLCRRANSSLTYDGGELIDGREHDPSWKAATIYNQALWLPAKRYNSTDALQGRVLCPLRQEAWQSSRITSYTPDDFSLTDDSITSLQLPYGFFGFPRATIREAKNGERIIISDVKYICNGKIDEQAYPQFSINSWRTIPIYGEENFKTSQIMSLEAVEVKEQRILSF